MVLGGGVAEGEQKKQVLRSALVRKECVVFHKEVYTMHEKGEFYVFKGMLNDYLVFKPLAMPVLTGKRLERVLPSVHIVPRDKETSILSMIEFTFRLEKKYFPLGAIAYFGPIHWEEIEDDIKI